MVEHEPLAQVCPLCCGTAGAFRAVVQGRQFYDCTGCRLVHLSPRHRLDPEAERAQYELHQNDPTDVRYRRFLERLAAPLLACLAPGVRGLDYGSGPGPTLSVMLEEQGHAVTLYDPFFAPDAAALERTYDFITCTEAAEHFFSPRQEFALLARLLNPRGMLAVMTDVLQDAQDFAQWRYARDPTHVCFYRRETFEWLAEFLNARLTRPHANVALFQLCA